MARYICGDCWQDENPDSYKPDGEDDMGACDACDAPGLLYRDDVDAFVTRTCIGQSPDPMTTDLPEWADSAEEFFA